MNDYLLIFSAGLLGSAHCIAMCGGLVMACAAKFGGGVYFSLLYNTGRLLSYSIIGFLLGLLGKGFITAGVFGKFQNALPVAAGILMVLIGIDLLGIMPKGLRWLTSGLFPKTISDMLIGRQIKKSYSPPILLGIFNGLLPCGLVYAIGVRAAATGDPLHGMLSMTVFGIGTLPALMTINLFTNFIGRIRSGVFLRISSAAIIILGIKLIFSSFIS